MIVVRLDLKGVDAAIKSLEQYKTIQELEARLEDEGDFLVERMRQNAPIRTGALRRSLTATVSQPKKGSQYRLSFVSRLPYALRVHEEEFQLGPLSRRQPPTPEGNVGNKYITRVLYYHRDRFLGRIAKGIRLSLRRITPGGRVRVLQTQTLGNSERMP